MAQKLTVNSYAEMESAGKQVQSLAGEYRDRSQDFKRIVEGMRDQSIWQGADNDAFIEQVNRLIQSLDSLAEKLDTEGNNIITEQKNYADRQDTVKGAISGLNA